MPSILVFLAFTFSALFVSCTHLDPIKARFPASIADDGHDDEIRIDAKEFSEFDRQNHDFFDFIKTAQDYNYKKIIIEPKLSDFKTISAADPYVSGDFIVLIGTNYSSSDEAIRRGDYNDIYDTIKKVSELKFKTTINLVASVTDLRAALKNNKPTIIMWTSHGNDHHFYDFNQIQVPDNILKDASPMVYQVLLTSCHGFLAFNNTYKKHAPNNLWVYGWDRIVWHPGDVKRFFDDKSWTPYDHYPITLKVNGMVCEKKPDGYVIKKSKDGTVIPRSFANTFQRCAYKLTNSDENYLCVINENDRWDLYNHKTNKVQPGVAFDADIDCHSRITNAINGRVCRFISDDQKHHYVDKNNTVSKESFESINQCSEYIQKTFNL